MYTHVSLQQALVLTYCILLFVANNISSIAIFNKLKKTTHLTYL